MQRPAPVHALLAFAFSLHTASGTTPDFARDVAPIFEAHCLSCHNPDDAEGDFVLDTREHALGLDQGIVPGDPDASLLIDAVTGPDAEMPKKADPLSPEKVAVLRDWVAAGAPWPAGHTLADNPPRDLDWWSLQPIRPPKPPSPAENPIDAFLAQQHEKLGLVPVDQASPATLVRRLTYDLTGLPPTPAETDAFLANPDWEALVDRLLASSAFGEKWGQHWLDLARYGETHGYDKDKLRPNAWPYRDYVIRSLNQDKPYHQFVQEQVAGDALFPGQPDGVLGLGFLAAGPWDYVSHWEVEEKKIDGQIAKHIDRDEMVAAVFNVFQSTTVQCAQCHHHKFDPVHMEDYYQLHAVFAAVDRADRRYTTLTPEEEKRRAELEARVAELTAKAGPKKQPQFGYHSLITKHQGDAKWVQVDLGQPRRASFVRLRPAHDDFAGIGAGFGFPVRYRVEASNDEGFTTDVRLLLDATEKDQPNPGTKPVEVAIDTAPFRFLRITATKLAERRKDYIFALGEVEILAPGKEEKPNLARGKRITSLDSIQAPPRWARRNLVDGIAHRDGPPPPPELAKLTEELATLQQGDYVYAATTTFQGGGKFRPTGGKPRPIHLLHRGDIHLPRDRMSPGAPPLWEGAPAHFDLPDGHDESQARAQLALYLTRDDNPLLWRSIANRVWGWTFGQPLVQTPNDFGRGGLPPSHPELLDFLAARLRDDPDRSLKSLVRLLVTSQAYRRASSHHGENADTDADNRFLWRAPRRRLTAEEFRDSLLAAAGALQIDQRGGASFRDFVIQKPTHSPHYQYHLHDPDSPDSHRRSIYRLVVRSQPQPMLTTLDCADPSLSTPARDESTTALQALTQWNHRFVEAMSRRLGERLKQEHPENPTAQVDHACRLTLARPPDTAERQLLLDHLDAHGPESLARVLFNLSAFVYVD